MPSNFKSRPKAWMWYCSACGYGPNNLSLDAACPSCGHWRCGDCTTRQENVRRESGFSMESRRTRSARFQYADDERRESRAPREPHTSLGNSLGIASRDKVKDKEPESGGNISTTVSGDADLDRVPLRAKTTRLQPETRISPPTLPGPASGISSDHDTDEEETTPRDGLSTASSEKETYAHEDVMSVVSVDEVPSLIFGTTISSATSTAAFDSPVQVLVDLFLAHGALNSLLSAGLLKILPSKFERNLVRLLKKYGAELGQEAVGALQIQAARMVRSRARLIATRLMIEQNSQSAGGIFEELKALYDDPRQQRDRIEEYLEQQRHCATDWVDPLVYGSKAERTGTYHRDRSSTDSDTSDAEQEIEPRTLERAKRFMIESRAFSRFYSELRYFVFPSTRKVKDRPSTLELTIGRWLKPLQSIIPQRMVPVIAAFLLGICRPRVREGHKRITWTCGCGRAMYADVKEAFDGGAQFLESELRKCAGQSSQTTSGKSIGTKAMTTGPGGRHFSASRSMGHDSSDSRPTRETTNRQATASTISGQPSTELAAPAREERFLLLCVNGNYTAELEQIAVLPSADDQILFQDIRRAYASLRLRRRRFHPEIPNLVRRAVLGLDVISRSIQRAVILTFSSLRLGWLVWWIGDSVFYIPKAAHFVRFELVPVKTDVCPQILEFPCLPPAEEVLAKNYHYHPCPAEVVSCAMGIQYLHVLFEPGNHLDSFWVSRTPKKLKSKLEYAHGAQPAIGWGLHIVEGLNWRALWVLFELVMLFSLLCVVIYASVCGDIPGAFTISTYFLTVLSLLVTLLSTVAFLSLPA